MRLNLRTKMMLFAALIAVLPLLTSGQSIIRIAQDELKSAANEQLAGTVRQITDEFNAFFEFSMYSPLDLIRSTLGNEALGAEEKLFILRQGISDLPDIVTLQVDVEGLPQPIIVAQEDYIGEISEKVSDPMEALKVTSGFSNIRQDKETKARSVEKLASTDQWLATASLPIMGGISGRRAVLHARIRLNRLAQIVKDHPFARAGDIHVVNKAGTVVFSNGASTYNRSSPLAMAQSMLGSETSTLTVQPFELSDGAISLGAISVPRAFPWAIIAEKAEADAYQPITDMISNLLRWLAVGLVAAIVGAFLFSLRLSTPILRIGKTALQIAEGDLTARVTDVKTRDEIGELATRFNTMIVQLNERFELQKFVSKGTIAAIQGNEDRKVSLGGDRRHVTILFADIRGYTAFSESREPEEVVRVLNSYFEIISGIVADHHGDIDKFVGDEVMALFGGTNQQKHAVECAIAIMDGMEQMTSDSGADLRIGIGINSGEVVVGAMGSTSRMDFTVLGDHVNLSARLCARAAPDETLVSRDVLDALPEKLTAHAKVLEPIKVKGKSQPIEIFGFYETNRD